MPFLAKNKEVASYLARKCANLPHFSLDLRILIAKFAHENQVFDLYYKDHIFCFLDTDIAIIVTLSESVSFLPLQSANQPFKLLHTFVFRSFLHTKFFM